MDKPTKNKNLQTANDEGTEPLQREESKPQLFWQLLRQESFFYPEMRSTILRLTRRLRRSCGPLPGRRRSTRPDRGAAARNDRR